MLKIKMNTILSKSFIFLVIVSIMILSRLVIPFDAMKKVGKTFQKVGQYITSYQRISYTSKPTTVERREQAACQTPRLDPFEKSLLPFISHVRKFKCQRIQPNLTYIDVNTDKITLNQTLLRYLQKRGKSAIPINCFWKSVEKGEGSKNAIEETPYLPFNEITLEKDGIIQIHCKRRKKLIYYNLHVIPQPLKKLLSPPTQNKLSVYILLIESMSKARFDRHMRSLNRFMEGNFGTHIFKSFSKVADNTYVNLIPMFTGKRAFRQQADMPDEFQRKISKSSYDDINEFIWKDFSKEGYATAFIEDEPHIGTFEYNKKGFFSKKPFDFYFRPFFLRLKPLTKKSSKYCSDKMPVTQLQLDLPRRILELYGNTQKLFLVDFHVRIGHDHENVIEQADNLFTEHFKHLHGKGLLNKTVLFILGDHGARFGKVRLSQNGYFEERLPFLSVTFPKWFLDMHPKISKNLQTNTRRLVTHFDIHATLKDILNANFKNLSPIIGRGQSILRSILHNRTCSNAGIPEFYCPCYQRKILPTTTKNAQRVAHFLVNHINKLLDSKPKYKNKCERIILKKIMHFEYFTSNKPMYQRYKVTIKTKPAGAIFEGFVRHNVSSDIYSITNNIGRLDKYGKAGRCLKSRHEMFCYCKKQQNG